MGPARLDSRDATKAAHWHPSVAPMARLAQVRGDETPYEGQRSP